MSVSGSAGRSPLQVVAGCGTIYDPQNPNYAHHTMPTPHTLRIACLAGAVALTSMPVTAQLADAPLLVVGRTMDGSLTRTDATINERGRFKVYRIDVKPGTRYSIVMRWSE